MPRPDRVEVALVDANGGDGYTAKATFIELPAHEGGARNVKKDCEKQSPCEIALHEPTAKPSDLVFVLRGFRFRRPSGSDANVRRIMGRGSVASRNAQVAFVDDSGAPYQAEIQHVYAPAASTTRPREPYEVWMLMVSLQRLVGVLLAPARGYAQVREHRELQQLRSYPPNLECDDD